MAESTSKTDMVMMFKQGNTPVRAECALQVDTSDPLMDGFGENLGYDWYANFFEVTDFSFGAEVEDNTNNQQNGTPGGTMSRSVASTAQVSAGQPQKAKKPFAGWRSALATSYTGLKAITDKYDALINSFTFTRVIDSASPVFFYSCCLKQEFTSAALVKRVSLGDINQGLSISGSPKPVMQFGFLRIDFDSVLITGINWDDGDMVKEKCTFVCRGLTVKFMQQNWDGTFKDKVPASVTWREDGTIAKLGKV